MSFDELKANAEYELLQEQKYCDEVHGWYERVERSLGYEHQRERVDYFYEGET